jgi:hypothetical protein
MTAERDRILERLRAGHGTEEAYGRVRAWADAGEIDELVALWTAVDEASASQATAWGSGAASRSTAGSTSGSTAASTSGSTSALAAVADEVVEALALAKGERSLAAVLDLAVRAPKGASPAPEMRARAIASRLAFARPKDDLYASIARAGAEAAAAPASPATFELLACWLHELVCRGAKLDADEPARALASALAARGHALASLPLRLLASEREAPSYMPMYGAGAIDKAVARLERGPQSSRTVPPPAEHEAPKATRIEDPAFEARLATAVRPWIVGSNGKAEARVFSLSPRLETTLVGKWLLRALPLASTRDAGAGGADGAAASSRASEPPTSPSLSIQRVEPEAAWGTLFGAAANGGAYTSGMGGAYGRAAAWASFGALVGLTEGASLDAIDEIAARTSFLAFGGPDWFHDVAWDAGLLALRSDGASVAVLAATDTD